MDAGYVPIATKCMYLQEIDKKITNNNTEREDTTIVAIILTRMHPIISLLGDPLIAADIIIHNITIATIAGLDRQNALHHPLPHTCQDHKAE
jgi:hypothetical protein